MLVYHPHHTIVKAARLPGGFKLLWRVDAYLRVDMPNRPGQGVSLGIEDIVDYMILYVCILAMV